MNRTLKDFYYGNLRPVDQQIMRGSEVSRIAAELSSIEKELTSQLPPDLLPLLERYSKAQQELDGITAESYYIAGFKTGARLMREVMDDTPENIKPIVG